ncbi:hypothetical protein QEH52_19500 [Coraliomargarita sp. SDUM461003]|uniref:Uncharacterized protein n=1 Tax=Thalassobacterium maritimum TaxID=3041265 RepID=A0ABU1AZZ8_9BACT|nr:hypothetical protein [Coraliomargarita sp. SDUM461003]MDQ8209713.1 hypothetical protein [Coraliomargarita sp. SDUM461003]
MKHIILLLLSLAIHSLMANEGVDPFNSLQTKDPYKTEKVNTEIWMYTIYPEYPKREELPEDYIPFEKEYDEEMNAMEMEWFRFLQVNGVSFIGVDGSLISISSHCEDSIRPVTVSARHRRTSYFFIKQTPENQEKIIEIFKHYWPTLKAEPVR